MIIIFHITFTQLVLQGYCNVSAKNQVQIVLHCGIIRGCTTILF